MRTLNKIIKLYQTYFGQKKKKRFLNWDVTINVLNPPLEYYKHSVVQNIDKVVLLLLLLLLKTVIINIKAKFKALFVCLYFH